MLSGQPFVTTQGRLVQAATESLKEIVNLNPELSTGGGTSDARFIAPTGAEVIEIGPCTHSAHALNEHVNINDLEPLMQIYQQILKKLML